MLLGHGLWQRRFGGDPAVVGRTVIANGQPYTVVGVMPPGFDYPGERYQLWVPLPFATPSNTDGLPVNRDSRYLQVVGRLKPGVTPEQAAAPSSRRSAARWPRSTRTATRAPRSRMASLDRGDGRALCGRRSVLLLGAAGLVLLIACANVTSLLLARASTRAARDGGALGARRRRVRGWSGSC